MTRRFYRSMAAALVDLTAANDLASAAYLSNGKRPTVIRIRHDDESTVDRFVCIIGDDGLSVARKGFHSIEELETILEPTFDDDPTYVDAVASFLKRSYALGYIAAVTATHHTVNP